jgi:hypothetical protein
MNNDVGFLSSHNLDMMLSPTPEIPEILSIPSLSQPQRDLRQVYLILTSINHLPHLALSSHRQRWSCAACATSFLTFPHVISDGH